MARGRHRLNRSRGRDALALVSGALVFTGGSLFAIVPASADSCFETADTGWVCTSDVTGVIDSSVPIGGPGQLPGATDPSAYLIDPSAYAEKQQLVAADQVSIAANL